VDPAVTDVPKGFEKPRRKLPDLKWLGIPLLALGIFAFIMIKVRAAKVENDRIEGELILARMQYQMNSRAPEPLPELPDAERDKVDVIGEGTVVRHFGGLVMHHPLSWETPASEPMPYGRTITFMAEGSGITIYAVKGITSAEVTQQMSAQMTDKQPVERTIAGTQRSGEKGTLFLPTGARMITELYGFLLGATTIVVMFQYLPSNAEHAPNDLAMLTRLELAP
jgi:hypothetical protein